MFLHLVMEKLVYQLKKRRKSAVETELAKLNRDLNKK